MTKQIRNILLLLLLVVILVLMRQLSSILLPLVLASLFVMINLPLVEFLIARRIPRWLSIVVVALLSIGILSFVINIFVDTFTEILSQQLFLIRR